jgi:transposase InsO family protein
MLEIEPDALFRFQVISHVLARLARGEAQVDAIAAVAAVPQYSSIDGSLRTVSARSLYRWLATYRDEGLKGLQRRPRASPDEYSPTLPEAFINLLCKEKAADATTSIPEIIRTAREKGILKPDDVVDRTTVYRTAKKLGLPVAHCRACPPDKDMRRFAYPHRLDMLLADGKHFRAGPTRARRVALFFLDDATRFVLNVLVGTSESAELFLRGLYGVVLKYGLISGVYLDRGPGFIAADTFQVIANLGGHLILGEAAYPQGHGKIERFNQTALRDLLRGFDRRPDVDSEPHALTFRIRHYLETNYNQRPHESLDKETPFARFHADEKALRFLENQDALRAKFEVTIERGVSNDNVVSIGSVDYEMPRGYRGRKVHLRRRVIGGAIFFLHQGRLIELHPVDLAANARNGRAQTPPPVEHPPRTSAADLAFQREYGPVVDADGGFSNPTTEDL